MVLTAYSRLPSGTFIVTYTLLLERDFSVKEYKTARQDESPPGGNKIRIYYFLYILRTLFFFFAELYRVKLLSISPDTLQIIEQTVLTIKYMNYHIAVIHQYPVSSLITLYIF